MRLLADCACLINAEKGKPIEVHFCDEHQPIGENAAAQLASRLPGLRELGVAANAAAQAVLGEATSIKKQLKKQQALVVAADFEAARKRSAEANSKPAEPAGA